MAIATAANPHRTGLPVRIRLATVHKLRILSRRVPSLLGRPSAAAADGWSDIAGRSGIATALLWIPAVARFAPIAPTEILG